MSAESAILGLVVLVVVILAILVFVLIRFLRTLNDQHRGQTYVATIRGLVSALEHGGYGDETRDRIFRAIDEQWALYDGPLVKWAPEREKRRALRYSRSE